MGASSDNDYCPNCGGLHCSASCYYRHSCYYEHTGESTEMSREVGWSELGIFEKILIIAMGVSILVGMGFFFVFLLFIIIIIIAIAASL